MTISSLSISDIIETGERIEKGWQAAMFDAKDGIELLGSARHDFLNDLQLIKGYLFLKKPEKAEEVVKRVTEKLYNQSRLAHLHIPNCAVFLMKYGWSSHAFQLVYDIDGPENDLSAHDEDLRYVFQALFTFLEQNASQVADNKVRVVMDTEVDLRIHLFFEGQLKDNAKAEGQLSKLNMNHSFQWVEHYMIVKDSNQSVRWNMCLSIK